MILRLQTRNYRFIYTFVSGHKLVGTVQGDNYAGQPETVFDLRSLKAICLERSGELMLKFDEGFGQFKRDCAETIVSGSHSLHNSFFSINYRHNEACIYDAVNDHWISNRWRPDCWYLEELPETLPQPQPEPRLPQVSQAVWLDQAIA